MKNELIKTALMNFMQWMAINDKKPWENYEMVVDEFLSFKPIDLLTAGSGELSETEIKELNRAIDKALTEEHADSEFMNTGLTARAYFKKVIPIALSHPEPKWSDSPIPKTIGYTEIVKITEGGLNSDRDKVIKFIERFIAKFPESDLCHPFTHLLKGNTNPDGLTKLNSAKWSDERVAEATKEDILDAITGYVSNDNATLTIPRGWILQAMQQYADAVIDNIYKIENKKYPTGKWRHG